MIIIKEEPPLVLTPDQRDRLLAEYNKSFTYFSGQPPTFEEWARQRLSSHKVLLQE